MKPFLIAAVFSAGSVSALAAETTATKVQKPRLMTLSETLDDAKLKLSAAEIKAQAFVISKSANAKDEAATLSAATTAMKEAEISVDAVNLASRKLRQSLGSCKESATSGFNNFTAATGSDITLATSELATAYTNLFTGTRPGSRIGLRLTSSLPIEIKDQKNYVDHELQLRDGGIANFSLSYPTTASASDGCQSAGRLFKVDRFYFKHAEHASNDKVGMGYFFSGLGVRGIKRGDQNSDAKEKTSAAGYLYLGLGLDGPLHSPLGNDGFYDASIRYTYNRVNKDFLAPLYANGGIENIQSLAVAFKFNLSDAAAASIEFSTPVGGAKSYGMGEVALLSLTYAPAKPARTDKSSMNAEPASNHADTVGDSTKGVEQGPTKPPAPDAAPKKNDFVNVL